MRGTNKRGTNGQFCKSKRIEKLGWVKRGEKTVNGWGKLYQTTDIIIEKVNEQGGSLEGITQYFYDRLSLVEARLKKLEEQFSFPLYHKTSWTSTTAPDTKKECEHIVVSDMTGRCLNCGKYHQKEECHIVITCGSCGEKICKICGKRIR